MEIVEDEEELTNDSKKEYVELVLAYYLNSTKKQMEALRQGFLEIFSQEFLDDLEPHELELMLFGQQEIDVKDLQENTDYENGFSVQTPTVKMFWEVLEKFSQDQLRNFLAFTTGSPKVPLGGFAHLFGSNGPQKFTLNCKSISGLPNAHACFNRLDLCVYSDVEKLKKDLFLAISETSGFTLE